MRTTNKGYQPQRIQCNDNHHIQAEFMVRNFIGSCASRQSFDTTVVVLSTFSWAFWNFTWFKMRLKINFVNFYHLTQNSHFMHKYFGNFFKVIENSTIFIDGWEKRSISLSKPRLQPIITRQIHQHHSLTHFIRFTDIITEHADTNFILSATSNVVRCSQLRTKFTFFF